MAEIKRTYTIPLRRNYANVPRHQRAHKAVRVMKLFLTKHMKSDDVKIGKNLNDHIWQNGIRNPPSKVKVIAIKDNEGTVRVELEGKQYVDFKVKDKVDQNQTFKEKLQNKVAEAKGSKPEEETVEKAASSKTETGKDSKKEEKEKVLKDKEAGSKKTATQSPKAPKAEVPSPKETKQGEDVASKKN